MSDGNKEQNEKLLQLVREAVEQDNALREKFQIENRFRFIRDRLEALCHRMEESIAVVQAKHAQRGDQLSADEVLVYVYIYNTQGLTLQTWQISC